MKAVQIHHYGGPEELKYEDADDPVINPDDVLIRVHATSVNPVDWKIRNGARKEQGSAHFPLILGWDVSGVIERAGARVKGFNEGDEVYGRPDPGRNGAYAEYIAVRASEIALKPKTLDHSVAAAVPLAGLTAWQGLFDHGKLKAGQKVLIHGAAGGVGTMAVQLAKWKGAYVIGTAAKDNIDFLKELGADEVIDYQAERFEEKLTDLDLVFDTIGGEVQARSLNVLKPGGTIVSTVGIRDKEMVKSKGLHGEQYMAQSDPEQLRQLAHLIDQGKLIPVIARTMPLKEAAQAQQISEEGHTRGKIVLKVSDGPRGDRLDTR
ncbi:MAG: NADP-dependent oxidoreductase [Bacteroidota bacterium]|nr:NADP-dependent oxidoreductase [Bacteroidota bacterium]MDP4218779.1 NADP-dependent oxidoreductase [Bacteroidota bacterium]MDP4244928.1 NADP-dependent oxidoreductase [Bacteroidota bacterium]MDP4254813.1 NADP-dependent oxidoreductase [Bacteroidota bacterium]MDP4257572.1 NADP-dependent oxidoreductase [Bacteroidota bacterium]